VCMRVGLLGRSRQGPGARGRVCSARWTLAHRAARRSNPLGLGEEAGLAGKATDSVGRPRNGLPVPPRPGSGGDDAGTARAGRVRGGAGAGRARRHALSPPACCRFRARLARPCPRPHPHRHVAFRRPASRLASASTWVDAPGAHAFSSRHGDPSIKSYSNCRGAGSLTIRRVCFLACSTKIQTLALYKKNIFRHIKFTVHA